MGGVDSDSPSLQNFIKTIDKFCPSVKQFSLAGQSENGHALSNESVLMQVALYLIYDKATF